MENFLIDIHKGPQQLIEKQPSNINNNFIRGRIIICVSNFLNYAKHSEGEIETRHVVVD